MILFGKINRLEKQIIELSYAKERVNVITDSTLLYQPNKAEPSGTEKSSDTINVEIIEKENIEDAKVEDDDEESSVETVNEVDETAQADENVKAEETDADAADSDEDVEVEESTCTLKRVYLTFDDGPSSNTAKILDILNEYDVKGTFFVVGRLSDTTTPMYKRIVDEGHSIGMHSYTHKYNEVYSTVDSFVYDVEKIQSLIYEQTGVLSKLYRFPGGSSNRVSKTDMSLLEAELGKRDIKYYDWNVTSGDATSAYGLSKEEIVRRCTVNALGQEDAVILMHDLPEKATTVAALPQIIEYFQSIGVEILPIDDNTAEIHHAVNITE